MPTECAHATCRNVNTNKALSFHRFPKSKERLDRWTYLMRRHAGWRPKRWDLVCSAHFLETDFDRTGQTTRLREGVEPSVFDVPRHLRRKINERSTSNSKRQKLAVTEPVAESIEEASPSESSGLLNSWHSYAAPNQNTFKEKWLQAESRVECLQRKLSNALKREHRSKSVSLSLSEVLRVKNLLTDELRLKLNAFKDCPIQLFKTSRTRYSEEQRRFALTLHLYGPKAYEYLARKVPLPSTRILRRWLSHADGSAGISEPIIAALGQKVKEQPATYQNAALIIDAMSIRKQIVYDSREKTMTGFVDLGDGGESEDEASEVLVFMVVGLCGYWKAPVAHYLTRGLQAGTQKQLLLHSLHALHEIGIRVWTVTMDGHATNVAVCKELGCKLSAEECSPTFPHPDDPTNSVAIIFDPGHMLKLFRNLLDAYGCVRSPTGRVDWTCIKALSCVQEQAGLCLGHGLSRRHISSHRQRMKVNLAAQAISNLAANSLQCLQEVGHPDFTETSATVEFLQTIDRLIDVLTSRNTVARGYKSAIRRGNWLTISTFLQSAKTYLTSLKTLEGMPLSQSKRHTAVTGFVITITSLQQVVPRLLETQGFILTYKFSQDHLELFFNAVRRAGGRNDDPNAQQFLSTFRKLVAHCGAVTGTTGNIVKLDDTNTLAYSTLSADVQITIDEEHDQFTAGGRLLMEHDYATWIGSSSKIIIDSAVPCIAGWVTREILPKLKCDVCRSILVVPAVPQETPYHLLSLKNSGGLVIPSPGTVQVLLLAEKTIQRLIDITSVTKLCSFPRVLMHVREKIGGKDIWNMGGHIVETQHGVDNHYTSLLAVIIEKYFNLRSHHIAKMYNIQKQVASFRQKFSRLVLFKGQ